ncbi:MAG: exodeoxyribonuclease VII small subunit [Tepidisphaerales bacterium]
MAKKTQTPPKSYEEAVQELQQIIAEIERGEIGLEDVLSRYERGHFLLQFCQQTLTAGEKQIELIAKSPDGALKTEPLPEQP